MREVGGDSTPGASRSKSAVINASWNVVSTCWTIGISFVLAPLLIHGLGTAEYGLLLLMWSLTGILGVMSFGLGEATLRYVAHYYADDDMLGIGRVFQATLSFYIFVCALVSAVVFVAAPSIGLWMNIESDDKTLAPWLLRLSALVFSVGMLSTAFSAIPRAVQRYDLNSKSVVMQSVVRSLGYALLVYYGFGIVQVILWDLFVSCFALAVYVALAHKLLPRVRWFSGLSFSGLQEILSYSILSFITQILHSLWRESPKLVAARLAGVSEVAFIGTPDNVAYRIYMIVISGIETLLPAFTSTRDPTVARSLVVESTWGALAASVILFVPLAALMPQFLRLWISPEFATQSGGVGQWMALSFIGAAAYAPVAAFYRGAGKPASVTATMGFAGITVLVASIVFMRQFGPIGIGYAYMLASTAYLFGTFWSWWRAFGTSSLSALARVVGLPITVGAVTFGLERLIVGRFGGLSWPGLFILAAIFAGSTAVILLAADYLLGGKSPSRRFLAQLSGATRRRFLLHRAIPRENSSDPAPLPTTDRHNTGRAL